MTAAIFDTETTRLDKPELIEAAHVLHASPALDQPSPLFHAFYKPEGRISMGAMATHHIMDEDLADCPPSSSFALPAGVEYLVGHNIDFDWEVIGKPNIKRIDTLALCRKLWPETDSHTQSAMMYLLEREAARERVKGAHSAAVDIGICETILRHILAKLGNPATWEEVWEQSELARIPEFFTFGKHKGLRIKEAPSDYKRWLLGQPDVDPYLRKALVA